ncbi:hypothetical protein [Pseudorhodoplanes sp.]|uniref:hypothetical protein n=1 Tax=Pseudorhodoplanes sp. TaxID=1934341 RepID=UPI002C937AEE|nr:hypothetical protein [Pseudorhodoplanes sp.]HWV54301.1 hypothetical protein [Pseudorhodoplanes sp.]
MAVGPDQDTDIRARAPELPGEVERQRTDLSVVSILAVLALCVAVGLWFYTKDQEMVAGDGTTVQTSGSGSQELPLPNTPGLPQPTPPQQ